MDHVWTSRCKRRMPRPAEIYTVSSGLELTRRRKVGAVLLLLTRAPPVQGEGPPRRKLLCLCFLKARQRPQGPQQKASAPAQKSPPKSPPKGSPPPPPKGSPPPPPNGSPPPS